MLKEYYNIEKTAVVNEDMLNRHIMEDEPLINDMDTIEEEIAGEEIVTDTAEDIEEGSKALEGLSPDSDIPGERERADALRNPPAPPPSMQSRSHDALGYLQEVLNYVGERVGNDPQSLIDWQNSQQHLSNLQELLFE